MKNKWIDVQVSQIVFDDMCERYNAIPPKKKKKEGEYSSLPYLEVIITGKEAKNKFEDFSKVMFPALCLYGWSETKRLGCINCAFINEEIAYELHDMDEQHDEINRQSGFESLEKLNECYNIEIVKAKIIAKRG